MKVKIELFGAARDFSEQNLLELDLEQKSTIKDIRKKIIQYLEQKNLVIYCVCILLSII